MWTLEICTLLRLTSYGPTSAQNSNKLKRGVLMALILLLEGSFLPHAALVGCKKTLVGIMN